MALNPLTYGMSALRQTLCGARMAGLPSLPESVSVLALFAAGTCAAAILSVIRRPSGGGA
jgi:ABC-type polysaccharide/polyol phosphate export permease